MKEYITIGTKNISKDIFKKVLRPKYIQLNNSDNIYTSFYKPTGGLWASEFISRIYSISQWHDYLLYENPEIALYRNINEGAIFSLKENARILTIDNVQKIIDTASKYPSYHYILTNNDINNKLNIIDYEAVSKDYDGIYVSVNQLGFSEIANTFNSWSVDTLLLFNLDCIKEYKSVEINISPFPFENPPYIKKISEPKQVLEYSCYYKHIYTYTEETFQRLLNKSTPTNYLDYYNTMIKAAEECITLINNNKIQIINKITERLKDNNINIKEEDLVRNIVYNYLSIYLEKNKYIEYDFIDSLKSQKHLKNIRKIKY